MNSNATVNVRVPEKVKAEAEHVLSELGIKMTEAINIYLRQIALHGGMPFEIRLPNEETVKAMRDVRKRRNLSTFTNVESLESSLNS